MGGVIVLMSQFCGYKPTLFARLVFYFSHEQKTKGCEAGSLETKPSLSSCQKCFPKNNIILVFIKLDQCVTILTTVRGHPDLKHIKTDRVQPFLENIC